MCIESRFLFSSQCALISTRDGSRISGKGVHTGVYNGVYVGVGGVRFGDFISFFLNIPWK